MTATDVMFGFSMMPGDVIDVISDFGVSPGMSMMLKNNDVHYDSYRNSNFRVTLNQKNNKIILEGTVSMLHVHISMPHVHDACLCFMSILQVHSACPCCMCMMHVHAAFPLHVHAVHQCSISEQHINQRLHVHSECPCYISPLHVHAVRL
jgi:hypothetical protein